MKLSMSKPLQSVGLRMLHRTGALFGFQRIPYLASFCKFLSFFPYKEVLPLDNTYLHRDKHIIQRRHPNKLLIHYFWDANSGESWGENVYTTAQKEHFGHVGCISGVNW